MLIVLTRKPTDGRWEFFQPTSASAFPISHPAYGKYTGLSVIREGVQFRLKVCFSLAFFFFWLCPDTWECGCGGGFCLTIDTCSGLFRPRVRNHCLSNWNSTEFMCLSLADLLWGVEFAYEGLLWVANT